PNIAYSTVCYVDESDAKALEVAAFRASRAYEGFLAPPKSGESFAERVAAFAKMFVGRGEPGASDIIAQRVRCRLFAQARPRLYRPPRAGRCQAARRSAVRRVQPLQGRIQFRRSSGSRSDALHPPVRRTGDSSAARLRAVLTPRHSGSQRLSVESGIATG